MQVKLTKPTVELFLTDLHFPTESPQVFNLITQVAKDVKPNILWLNGDTMDFKSISHFLTKPDARASLNVDIIHARRRLRQLRELLPDAIMYYKFGNHDLRLQKYLWSKAPELSGLEDLELGSLLRLNQLEAITVAEGEKALIGQLFHLHGHEIATGYTYPAKTMLTKANANVIFGHVHKFSVAYQNTLDGSVHVCWSIGCGQTLDVDYNVHPNWQEGFALIEYTKEGIFHINPIEVFSRNGKKCCMVYGRLYTAS